MVYVSAHVSVTYVKRDDKGLQLLRDVFINHYQRVVNQYAEINLVTCIQNVDDVIDLWAP